MSNFPIRRKTDRALPSINIAEAIQIFKTVLGLARDLAGMTTSDRRL
jgi:hypothetical protein